jgi:hypothetical protein
VLSGCHLVMAHLHFDAQGLERQHDFAPDLLSFVAGEKSK